MTDSLFTPSDVKLLVELAMQLPVDSQRAFLEILTKIDDNYRILVDQLNAGLKATADNERRLTQIEALEVRRLLNITIGYN